MKKGIYAIYDTIAQAITGILMIHINTNVAIRSFSDIVQSQDTLRTHAKDFELRHLADIEPDGKTLTPIPDDFQLVISAQSIIAALGEQGPSLVKEA